MDIQKTLEDFKADMELRGFSARSVNVYIGAVSLYLKYCSETAQTSGEESFRSYLIQLLREKKLAKATVNLYNSAIRFYLEITLEQNINYKRTARCKPNHRYPTVLTQEEVKKFLSSVDDLKYRAIFQNIYGSGLRVSEICSLQIGDIDSKSMRILVRQGKGKKDRYTILSNAGLAALREYWKAYRPTEYLFPGKSQNGNLGISAVEAAFRKYFTIAGINKSASVHTLRHSFATHLLEQGVPPLYIKELLGHSTFDATNIYLHLANTEIYSVRSPLDSEADNA